MSKFSRVVEERDSLGQVVRVKKDLKDVFSNISIKGDLTVENLVWNQFFEIYSLVKSLDLGDRSIHKKHLEKKLRILLEFYIILSLKGTIPPYIHMFAFHLPELLELHGPINLYNCQGIEKMNDSITRNYHQATNKHRDGLIYCTQLLQNENRREFYDLYPDKTYFE